MEHNAVDVDELDGNSLALPSQLDLSAAEPLYRWFADRVLGSEPIVIDGAAVERISTAPIQVLLVAASDARARGVAFQLQDPSPALTSALADLGLPSDLVL